MKIRDLKKWLKTLPKELNDHDLVFRKFITGDSENWMVKDSPITACGIDVGNNEAYFCDEKSHQVMINT